MRYFRYAEQIAQSHLIKSVFWFVELVMYSYISVCGVLMRVPECFELELEAAFRIRNVPISNEILFYYRQRIRLPV